MSSARQHSVRLVPVELPAAPEGVERLQAVWAAGDAAALLDPTAPRPERERVRAELRLDEPVEAGTAAVVATSGTAGRPKAVVLSHAALEVSGRATLDRLAAGPGDRWLCCLPLHRIAGLQILVRSRLLGTPAVIHPRFDPDAVAAEGDVTLVSVVPTMLARLLDAGVDLRRFRAVLVGGGPAPPGLLERARAAEVPLVTSYGMTETAGGCVYDGVPLDGVEVRLAADGRILIRGPVLCSGYRGRPALRDGWLHTADVGAWEADGRLRVLGRTDATIITGGEKVDPAEVADLLRAHPAVGQAAVFGRPDPEWGERVVARIVVTGEPPTLDDLRRWVKARTAAYKAPRDLEVQNWENVKIV